MADNIPDPLAPAVADALNDLADDPLTEAEIARFERLLDTVISKRRSAVVVKAGKVKADRSEHNAKAKAANDKRLVTFAEAPRIRLGAGCRVLLDADPTLTDGVAVDLLDGKRVELSGTRDALLVVAVRLNLTEGGERAAISIVQSLGSSRTDLERLTRLAA